MRSVHVQHSGCPWRTAFGSVQNHVEIRQVGHRAVPPYHCSPRRRTNEYTHPFRPLQGTSLAAYTLTLVKAVSFIIRVHARVYPAFDVPLTEEQNAACEALVDVLERPDDAHPPWQRLHELLLTLVAHEPVGALRDKFFSPLARFQVVFSLREDGRFMMASEICHWNAQLMYIVRSVIFHEILARCHNTDSGFFE